MAGLHFNITGNARGLGRALSLAQRDLNHTAREGQRLGRIMSGGGGLGMAFSQAGVMASTAFKAASIAIAGTVIVAGTAASAIVSHSAEMESAIMRVAAVSGASENQLGALTDRAFELGKEFGTTGVAAAEAMGFLAMAGSDAEQSMQLVHSSLMLASIGAIDAGRAADITTNIMTGMRLEAYEMGGVVDILANTITSFNVNMTHMGDAFKYAAPFASALEIDIAELSTAMGLLGNAGLQGEQGGTILRNMLLRLTKPTKNSAAIMKNWGEDFSVAAIKADGLSGIIRKLTSAGASLPDMSEVFGARAISGVLALMDEGADRIDYFTDKMNTQGTAAEINERIMQTFEKRVQSAKTAFAEASNVVGTEWRKSLLVAADAGEEYLKSLNITNDVLREFGQRSVITVMQAVSDLIPILFDVATAMAWVADVLNNIVNIFKVVTAAIQVGFMGALTVLVGGIVLGLNALNELIKGMIALGGATDAFKSISITLDGVVQEGNKTLSRMAQNVENSTNKHGALAGALNETANEASKYRGIVAGLEAPALNAAAAVDRLTMAMKRQQDVGNNIRKMDAATKFQFSREAQLGALGNPEGPTRTYNVGDSEAEALRNIQGMNGIEKTGQVFEIAMAKHNNNMSLAIKDMVSNANQLESAYSLQISNADKNALLESLAPDKAGYKAGGSRFVKPSRGGGSAAKKEIDELALMIKALEKLGRVWNAEILRNQHEEEKIDKLGLKNKMVSNLMREAEQARHLKALDKIAQDQAKAAAKEFLADFDALAKENERIEASKKRWKEWSDAVIAKTEASKKKWKEWSDAVVLARELAQADYEIGQLGSFRELELAGQLTKALSEIEAEAQLKFMTAEERKAQAIADSNAAIISQIEAMDTLQASIGGIIGAQLEYDKGMLTAVTAEEKRNVAQQRQVSLMNQAMVIAPALAQAFGASARAQMAIQTGLNAVMAVGQLAMGDYLGALGSFVGFIGGLIGLGGEQELQATPQLDEDTSANNKAQTTEAILEALKEAGLYQRERQSVVVNQTGNDPVAFNKTRDSRLTNASQNRNTRNRP